jgi:hypothetical protein
MKKMAIAASTVSQTPPIATDSAPESLNLKTT